MNPEHMLSLCSTDTELHPRSTTYQIPFSLGTVSKSDSVSGADLSCDRTAVTGNRGIALVKG